MDWYWWLIIALGVAALGAVKIMFFVKAKNKKKNERKYED